jgi:hypothetical protein
MDDLDQLPDNSIKPELPEEEIISPVLEVEETQEVVDYLHNEIIQNAAMASMPKIVMDEEMPKEGWDGVVQKAKRDRAVEEDRAKFLSPQKGRQFEG